MLNAAICDMLGIKYPIFQGGMAHIADARLAAAVKSQSHDDNVFSFYIFQRLECAAWLV